MKKFVYYSTFCMMFSDGFFITVGSINLFAAYVIVFLNAGILFLLGKLWFPRGLLVLFGFLLLTVLVGFSRGTVSAESFAKDFIGIVPNAIFACAFVRFMRFDVEKVFAEYAKYAYYVALIGLLLAPYQLITGVGRLRSVLSEPAGFCTVCIAALYFYADQWHRYGRYRGRFLVILLAFCLTFSSLGYMALLFGIYLFGTRFRFSTLFVPAVVVLVGLGIYSASELFRVRMDDTVSSLTTATLYDTNISSYGLVSNAYVTQRILSEHPITGGGLGSHVVSYDRFAPQMPGYEIFEAMGIGGLSRWDASSFLLRVASEFGLIGLIGCTFFLCRYFPWGSTTARKTIAQAVLCYVFAKCVRSGLYFSPEEWILFVVYGVNGMLARNEGRLRAREKAEVTLALPASPLNSTQPAF